MRLDTDDLQQEIAMARLMGANVSSAVRSFIRRERKHRSAANRLPRADEPTDPHGMDGFKEVDMWDAIENARKP